MATTINRKTRQFSDLNLLFSINPITADVTKKLDEEAVKASVRNLISTRNYERPFHPEIGCQIYSLLFENFNPIIDRVMRKTITQVLEKFEPRITVDKINVRESSDNNEITVEVYFRLINSEKPITVSTTLSRIR